jgi:lipopolysaccharide transport system ATP-binding protein
MTIAIKVDNISKRYKIGTAPGKFRYGMLRDQIAAIPRKIFRRNEGRVGVDYIWALKDVSFDLEEGRVLGIIGRNGAGKSTLLKVLARVTEPTKGTVSVRGRVGSLLEVGTGFHPELTGRDNIYLNGAISEVSQFIDTPVKRYSSGMYLRLAFAVAAHLEPEILVVDEVLAVGDAEFQRKCLGKMNDVAAQGRTVLFVSHNMSAILRLTQEAIVMQKGQLTLRAPTNEAVDFYLASGQSQAGERTWDSDEVPASAAPFRPLSLKLYDPRGAVADTVRSTEPLTVEMEYTLSAPITGLRVGIYLSTVRGEYVFTSFDVDDAALYETHSTRQPGHYISRCTLPGDMLNEGRYILGVNASSFGVKRYFMDENALGFTIDPSAAPGMQWAEQRQGPLRPRFDWVIENVGK